MNRFGKNGGTLFGVGDKQYIMYMVRGNTILHLQCVYSKDVVNAIQIWLQKENPLALTIIFEHICNRLTNEDQLNTQPKQPAYPVV